MDTTKANIEESNLLLEFEAIDRYGQSIIDGDPIKKRIFSEITRISNELYEKEKKQDSRLYFLTSLEGAEMFDDIMKNFFQD